jgi:alpha-beta hydrolase superfamily lysophospholipase
MVVETRPMGATDRCVVMVHGGPGGDKDGPGGLFIEVAHALNRRGMAAVRFDMPGCGEAPGDYVDMTMGEQNRHLCEVVAEASLLGYSRIAVLAESLGAAVALLNWPPQARVAALLWPAIDLMDTSLARYLEPGAAEQLHDQGYVLLDDGVRVGRDFIEEFQRVDDYLWLAAYALRVPTLVVHGQRDEEVPLRQSLKLYDLLKEPRELIVVAGGDHGLRSVAKDRLAPFCRAVVEFFALHL